MMLNIDYKKNANELTDELILELSKAIAVIDDMNDRLKYYYEKLDWEPEVMYTIEDGLKKLGIGLATLVLDKNELSKDEEKTGE